MSKGWNTNRTIYPVPWVLPWQTGRYYSGTFAGSFATLVPNNTLIYSASIYVPNPLGVTMTSFGAQLTATGTAGSLAREALYEMSDNGLPGKLIIDSGSFSTNVPIGFVGTTGLSKFLPQGWYVGLFASTGGTFQGLNSFVPGYSAGSPFPLDTTLDGWFRYAWTASAISGIISDGFPTHMAFDFGDYTLATLSPRMLIGI